MLSDDPDIDSRRGAMQPGRAGLIHAAIFMIAIGFGLPEAFAAAQQSMSMPGVENSVGQLSSGTSIEPRTTSESSSMIHTPLGKWTVMFHTNAVFVAGQQKGPRGRDKLFSVNWAMPMVQRQFGRHGVTLRTMLSLEPATITKRRYPLLFQTGETAYGLSILDGQHPHDFVMEMAGRYDFKVTERSQVFVYVGPVGEPALGPTAFPHRSSASENPLATLGHHQQDSTHIATNVLTLGLAAGPVQVEASTFHGREPNENRWNINRGKPDSFSTRLTVAPHKSLSTQFSTGRIHNPEAADLQQDTIRTTASLHHNLQFSEGHVSSSLIWGRNKNVKNGARRIFNSYTLELTAKFGGRDWVWTRVENVDRDRALLPVESATPVTSPVVMGLGISAPDGLTESGRFNDVVLGPEGTPVTIEDERIGRVQAYTIGYERELPIGPSWLNVGLGVQATVYGLPPQFKAVYGSYGSRSATVALFLRLRPAGNMAKHMKLMHQQ